MGKKELVTELDLVTLAILLFTWLTDAKSASVLGPYSVIFLSALGGAAWSATSRKPPGTLLTTTVYIFGMVGIAMIATLPFAVVISKYSSVEMKLLLAPVAVLITARPKWVMAYVRQLLKVPSKPAKEDQP